MISKAIRVALIFLTMQMLKGTNGPIMQYWTKCLSANVPNVEVVLIL